MIAAVLAMMSATGRSARGRGRVRSGRAVAGPRGEDVGEQIAGSALVIWAAAVDPAEVPTIRSASVTSTPAPKRPATMPITQALPVDPAPPRTNARSPRASVEPDGEVEEGVAFKGVPFAKLRVGRSRWRLHQSHDPGLQGAPTVGTAFMGLTSCRSFANAGKVARPPRRPSTRLSRPAPLAPSSPRRGGLAGTAGGRRRPDRAGSPSPRRGAGRLGALAFLGAAVDRRHAAGARARALRLRARRGDLPRLPRAHPALRRLGHRPVDQRGARPGQSATRATCCRPSPEASSRQRAARSSASAASPGAPGGSARSAG